MKLKNEPENPIIGLFVFIPLLIFIVSVLLIGDYYILNLFPDDINTSSEIVLFIFLYGVSVPVIPLIFIYIKEITMNFRSWALRFNLTRYNKAPILGFVMIIYHDVR